MKFRGKIDSRSSGMMFEAAWSHRAGTIWYEFVLEGEGLQCLNRTPKNDENRINSLNFSHLTLALNFNLNKRLNIYLKQVRNKIRNSPILSSCPQNFFLNQSRSKRPGLVDSLNLILHCEEEPIQQKYENARRFSFAAKIQPDFN